MRGAFAIGLALLLAGLGSGCGERNLYWEMYTAAEKAWLSHDTLRAAYHYEFHRTDDAMLRHDGYGFMEVDIRPDDVDLYRYVFDQTVYNEMNSRTDFTMLQFNGDKLYTSQEFGNTFKAFEIAQLPVVGLRPGGREFAESIGYWFNMNPPEEIVYDGRPAWRATGRAQREYHSWGELTEVEFVLDKGTGLAVYVRVNRPEDMMYYEHHFSAIETNVALPPDAFELLVTPDAAEPVSEAASEAENTPADAAASPTSAADSPDGAGGAGGGNGSGIVGGGGGGPLAPAPAGAGQTSTDSDSNP